MEKRIGVYVCHCGHNIAGFLDVEKVAAYAATLESVVIARHYTFMCSDPGQEMIKKDIKELNLNGVLVCSCSPNLHLRTFREACQSAGLNPHQCEMATIREQSSWVHSHDRRTATEKAMALVAAGVRRVAHRDPLEAQWAPVNNQTVIVGAGVAGIQAALEIASAEQKVFLVERESEIGGRVAEYNKTFPKLADARSAIEHKRELVKNNEYIEVLTDSEVTGFSGYIGNFVVSITNYKTGETREVDTGSVIVATGYDLFDPTPITAYGYGKYDNVITSFEFERMCAPDGPTEGKVQLKDGSTPKSVAIIHCVGSRDENFNAYCSRVCCMYSLKHAHLAKEQTGGDVYQMYIDMRCFGKGHEEFYKQVGEEGINFIRGKPTHITDIAIEDEEKGKLIVIGEDTLIGGLIRVPVDMVVLAVAIQPRVDSEKLARLFTLGRSQDGFFLERHVKMDPVSTMIDGIYAVGCCQGPKDIPDTVAQASGAAAKVIAMISKGSVEMEAATAHVDEDVCSGCGLCEAICAYKAVQVDPSTHIAKVNEAVCKGCGACAVNCPSKAMQLKNFSPKQLMDLINTATADYAGLAK